VTTVRVTRNGISCVGHSGEGDVCNAVGSAVQLVAHILERFDSLLVVYMDQAKGEYMLAFRSDEPTRMVRDAFAQMTADLAKQKPQYLTLEDLRG
jgi:hypothetical protein